MRSEIRMEIPGQLRSGVICITYGLYDVASFVKS